MTANDVTLTEAERAILLDPCECGHTLNDHGSLAGCWKCGEEPGREADECEVRCEDMFADALARILADRLAQVTARAERAEAQVERVRGLAAEWSRSDNFSDNLAARDLLAALAVTADSDSEPYVPPQSDERGEVAPGGRDESAGLSDRPNCSYREESDR